MIFWGSYIGYRELSIIGFWEFTQIFKRDYVNVYTSVKAHGPASYWLLPLW